MKDMDTPSEGKDYPPIVDVLSSGPGVVVRTGALPGCNESFSTVRVVVFSASDVVRTLLLSLA